jgi:YfiH family protein
VRFGDRRLHVDDVPEPFTSLRQVHGTTVVVVDRPGERDGVEADAAVTRTPGCRLVVRTADCVPVALLAAEAVGIAHAGWRGLLGGIVERAVEALGVDPASVRAEVGPCIRAGCYEFDGEGRRALAAHYGDAVLGTTLWGTPSVDLVAGVRAALDVAGVTDVHVAGGCTACDTTWYSHRARGDKGRQASFVWLEA